MNNLQTKSTIFKLTLISIFALTSLVSPKTSAQTEGRTYIINNITVKGNTNFSEQTIIAYSGLKKGEEVQLGGEKIAAAVKKLWKSNLFNSIEVYFINIEENRADLEINLTDLPELNELTINGIKDNKKEEIEKENNLKNK